MNASALIIPVLLAFVAVVFWRMVWKCGWKIGELKKQSE